MKFGSGVGIGGYVVGRVWTTCSNNTTITTTNKPRRLSSARDHACPTSVT
jgi:hypothetical protein